MVPFGPTNILRCNGPPSLQVLQSIVHSEPMKVLVQQCLLCLRTTFWAYEYSSLTRLLRSVAFECTNSPVCSGDANGFDYLLAMVTSGVRGRCHVTIRWAYPPCACDCSSLSNWAQCYWFVCCYICADCLKKCLAEAFWTVDRQYDVLLNFFVNFCCWILTIVKIISIEFGCTSGMYGVCEGS
jgi:hypothetical protein